MSVGAQDYIDQLLVKKYSKEQVDNHEAMESMVDPEKMMSAMNDLASVSRNMFILNQKLKSACYSIKAANAKYRKATLV